MFYNLNSPKGACLHIPDNLDVDLHNFFYYAPVLSSTIDSSGILHICSLTKFVSRNFGFPFSSGKLIVLL